MARRELGDAALKRSSNRHTSLISVRVATEIHSFSPTIREISTSHRNTQQAYQLLTKLFQDT